MIIDQLFEDDKKKKLNEVDPRNFDSDEDYYAAVRRSKRGSYDDDDFDYEPEDDINDMDDDESYYEKSLRSRGLGEDEQLDELSWKDIQRGAKKIGKGAQKFTKNVADTGAAIGGAARDVGGAIKQVGKTAIADPVSAAYGATKSGLNKAANVAANTYGDVKAGAQKIGQAGATVGTDLGNAAKSIGRGAANVAGGTAGALGAVAGGATTGAGRAAARGFNTGVKNVGGNAVNRLQTNVFTRKPAEIKQDIEAKQNEIKNLEVELKQASAPKAKAQQPWGIAAVNPATGKQWTPDELKALYPQTTANMGKAMASQDLTNVMYRPDRDLRNAMFRSDAIDPDAIDAAQQALGNKTPPQAITSVTPTAAPVTSTTTAASPAGWDDPKSPNYVGRREVARRQAAQPAAPAKPNFAQQGGYAGVNQPTAVKFTGMPTAPAAKPAQKLTPAEYVKKIGAPALPESTQPVAETVKQVKRMMETVTSKADVQRIKDYIDYHMGNNLTESAKVKRNRLISEVTQLAATRRREIARRMAQ